MLSNHLCFAFHVGWMNGWMHGEKESTKVERTEGANRGEESGRVDDDKKKKKKSAVCNLFIRTMSALHPSTNGELTSALFSFSFSIFLDVGVSMRLLSTRTK